ncbi:ParB-like chromosome segregation protein Spo0J [Bradyrhizobium sp. USDA 3240]
MSAMGANRPTEASLIENVAGEPMDELQEYEAFARLLKQGRKVEEIAATFGVTELRVKQRLAIAGLRPKIKEAFRQGGIESEDPRLLTSATRSQQKEWVDVPAPRFGCGGLRRSRLRESPSRESNPNTPENKPEARAPRLRL